MSCRLKAFHFYPRHYKSHWRFVDAFYHSPLMVLKSLVWFLPTAELPPGEALTVTGVENVLSDVDNCDVLGVILVFGLDEMSSSVVEADWFLTAVLTNVVLVVLAVGDVETGCRSALRDRQGRDNQFASFVYRSTPLPTNLVHSTRERFSVTTWSISRVY